MGGPGSGRSKEFSSKWSVVSGTRQFSRALRSSKIDYSKLNLLDDADEFDEKIKSFKKLRYMESVNMPKEVIEDFKFKSGLSGVAQNGTGFDNAERISQTVKAINETEDDNVKMMLTMSLMADQGGSGGGGGAGMWQPMMMMLQNMNKKEDTIQNKIMSKAIDEVFSKAKESDIDRITKTMKAIKDMGEITGMGGDSLDKMLADKKKLIDLGVVEEPSEGSVEKERIELEKRKIELEYDKMEHDSDAELELKKTQTQVLTEGMGTVTKFLAAYLSAGGEKEEEAPQYVPPSTPSTPPTPPSRQSSPPSQAAVSQNRPPPSITFPCTNPECKKDITVTVEDKKFECSNGCGFNYEIENNVIYNDEESDQKILTYNKEHGGDKSEVEKTEDPKKGIERHSGS